MSKEKSVKRVIITVAEAKEILGKLNVETIDQIQKRTLDYVSKFSKVSGDEAKKKAARLVSECGLTVEEAAELVNIMPKSIEEVRTFTSGWKKLIQTPALEKILNALAE